ncbi:MAG TPA: HDOD domain-containing protein [Synergistaceae bacterium]|nr:HDOD domain-containing protein [Synergistaceae bacterium]HPJ24633.1 HDOD domain-containing protein [Synergistaceae bacterium]HPQ36172.1 HDOD domain-containing protein [Synergistaceae bacterium]
MQGIDDRTKDLIQKRVLKRVKEIPSLPQFVIDTLKVLDNPESSAGDVAQKLSRDEGLVVRILRLANSAYYGFSRRITSVTEAIALLGFRAVKSIVLSASVYKFMEGSFTGYALDRGQLWVHSLGVAYVSKHLSQKFGADPEEAYVAGILHDLGKIVLNDFVRFGYSIIVRLVEEGGVTFVDAERDVLGFDHAQVASMIIEQWNLPESYQYVARYHHEPDAFETKDRHLRKIVDVVHVANSICLMLGLGLGADGLQSNISPGALERLGITDFETLLSESVDLITQVEEEFHLEKV